MCIVIHAEPAEYDWKSRINSHCYEEYGGILDSFVVMDREENAVTSASYRKIPDDKTVPMLEFVRDKSKDNGVNKCGSPRWDGEKLCVNAPVSIPLDNCRREVGQPVRNRWCEKSNTTHSQLPLNGGGFQTYPLAETTRPKYIKPARYSVTSLKTWRMAAAVTVLSNCDSPCSARSLAFMNTRSSSESHDACSGKPGMKKKATTERSTVNRPSRMKTWSRPVRYREID